MEIELDLTQDSKLKELAKSPSTRFIRSLITEVELQIEAYLGTFPGDDSVECV